MAILSFVAWLVAVLLAIGVLSRALARYQHNTDMRRQQAMQQRRRAPVGVGAMEVTETPAPALPSGLGL